jgi:hypothetical protein
MTLRIRNRENIEVQVEVLSKGGRGGLEVLSRGGRGGGGAATTQLYCSSACWQIGAWNQVVAVRTIAMASPTSAAAC